MDTENNSKGVAFTGLILAGVSIALYAHELIYKDFSWKGLFLPVLAIVFINQGYLAFLKKS